MFCIDSESVILHSFLMVFFFLLSMHFETFNVINSEMRNVCVTMMIKWLQPTRRSFYGIFCDNKLSEIEFCYHFVEEEFLNSVCCSIWYVCCVCVCVCSYLWFETYLHETNINCVKVQLIFLSFRSSIQLMIC